MTARIHRIEGACNRPRQSSKAMQGSYRPPVNAHDYGWYEPTGWKRFFGEAAIILIALALVGWFVYGLAGINGWL